MSSIILHQVGSIAVGLDQKNGYVNATRLCSAYTAQKGTVKRPENWRSTKAGKDYVAHVSTVTGIPVTELIIVRQGGAPEEQGTWIHPDLADAFAAWLSVEYQYSVSKWLQEWRSGESIRKFPESTIGHVDKYPELKAQEQIAHALDLILGPTGMHPNLIAGVKLEAIATQFPDTRPALESAKKQLALPLEAKLLTPTELATVWADRTGEKLSAIKVNKKLEAANLQKKNPGGNPSWEAIGQGIEHSLVLADTAKGHAKTVQSLRWYESVLDLLG